MSHRLTADEKGKMLRTESSKGPPTARVKVQESDNSELIQKHALTLIGRVTNPSAQKVWSLIPFFTEHWKTEKKPAGADLGNGLFQFQFTLESDLLRVLEQRPYHYARWMVIIQRWEPTISPSFPSLIPFWIKIQGIPVHLWTEKTIESIGDELGVYEGAEITPLSVRIRVQVNGLLPLIKTTIVEYPNGDEVTASLVYERLDKHCSMCCRLDHELKECLEAKHRNKAIKAANEEEKVSYISSLPQWDDKPKEPRQDAFRFSASRKSEERSKWSPKRDRSRPASRPYKENSNSWQERPLRSQSYCRREGHKNVLERGHVHSRHQGSYRTPSGGQSISFYREISRKEPAEKEQESSTSRAPLGTSVRGVPLQSCPEPIPQEAVKQAMVEVRQAMIQYTNHADPTEREARRERMRLAEEEGQIEETAINMLCPIPHVPDGRASERELTPVTERVPISQRLGPLTRSSEKSPLAASHVSSPPSQVRLPASLRLGPPEPPLENVLLAAGEEQKSPESERIPATQRLGATTVKGKDKSLSEVPKEGKRKPGRPLGKKTDSTAALPPIGPSIKRRRVATTKPSPVRRRNPQMGRTGSTSKTTARRYRKQFGIYMILLRLFPFFMLTVIHDLINEIKLEFKYNKVGKSIST
ncbi:hypothetical protein Bca101_080401 [Brassica carinata]